MSYLTRIFEASEDENRRAILSMLPVGQGGSLLDLGCHEGEFTTALGRRVGATEIHGVEFLEQHALRARARGIEVAEVDLNGSLPYPDDSFDFVHSNQVIEHLRHTDTFIAEIARVLRPDGIGIIGTNNLSSWHNVVSLVMGLQPMPMHVSDELIVGNPLNPQNGQVHKDAGRIHLRIFTARALKELCESHGLPVERVITSGYYPLPPRLARLACRIDRLHGAFLITVVRGGSEAIVERLEPATEQPLAATV